VTIIKRTAVYGFLKVAAMIPNGKVAATIMELKNTSPENTS
jgi:hypothetical protein